jgi:hypothetical protein
MLSRGSNVRLWKRGKYFDINRKGRILISKIECFKSESIITQTNKHTLSAAGNATLGPLPENPATFGESTQFPTMLLAGDIFATGEPAPST